MRTDWSVAGSVPNRLSARYCALMKLRALEPAAERIHALLVAAIPVVPPPDANTVARVAIVPPAVVPPAGAP